MEGRDRLWTFQSAESREKKKAKRSKTCKIVLSRYLLKGLKACLFRKSVQL